MEMKAADHHMIGLDGSSEGVTDWTLDDMRNLDEICSGGGHLIRPMKKCHKLWHKSIAEGHEFSFFVSISMGLVGMGVVVNSSRRRFPSIAIEKNF